MSKVQHKQARRRAEIIDTTLRLMNDIPFEALSVTDICEAAGISVGSFYHYFQRKTDLLVGLLSRVDEFLEETLFPTLTHEDEVENLRSLSHSFALYVQQNGLERSKLISGLEPYDTDLNGQPRSLPVKLAEILARGQEKGQITTAHSPEELTRFCLIALRGVAVDWTRHRGQYDLVPTMDAYMGLFLSSLSPR
jgi:AcrR family transcriptional regulator